MFFLLFLIFFVIFILFSKINVYIKKREFVYYIKLKINVITIINKQINNLGKKKKSKINIFEKVKDIKENIEEIWNIFLDVNKKFNIEKLKIYVSISNNDYIKGSYYIAALNAVQYSIKNICNKLEASYKYNTQKEKIKFNFDINFNFRLYNNIINFVKVLIIIIRISKKGKMKNGTTSNRKFNGNSNVVY